MQRPNTSARVATAEASEEGFTLAVPSRQAIDACVALCCASFLYLETFRLPWIPRIATGDQAIYLQDAARMFDGQTIYRNFDHFTFPGTSGLYFILFRIFGVREWIPQAMLVVLGTLTAWLSFRICRKLMTGPAVFLPGVLFVTMPFVGYLDATHHWYSALAATAALAVLVEERTAARLAWSGFFWGLATCFAQSMVVGVVATAIFLVWEARRDEKRVAPLRRQEASLCAAYAATLFALNGYIISKVGFRRFFEETVVFVFKYYPADRFNSWRAYFASRPSLHELLAGWSAWLGLPAYFLVHLLLPLIYVLFFYRYWKRPQDDGRQPWERLMLITAIGAGMLLMVASAASSERLYTVSLPGLILLVWFLDSLAAQGRIFLRVLWGVVALLAILNPLATQLKLNRQLNLPSGRTAFMDSVPYEKMKWVSERTKPGDYFFGDQSVSFALRLRNPGRVEFVRPTDYTRPEQVTDLIQGLETHKVRFVSWYPGLDGRGFDPRRDHLGPLREYMTAHYHVAAQFANGDKIWERN